MALLDSAVDKAAAAVKADIPLAESAAKEVIEVAIDQFKAMIETLLAGYTVTISVTKKEAKP